MRWEIGLGASLAPGGARFLVWAPHASAVDVILLAPEERSVAMERKDYGYFEALVAGVSAGADYAFRLDGGAQLADPASRFQPAGVHGPSRVVSSDFDWGDDGWTGLPMADYVIYELHVGTFTPDGTFEAVIPHLPRLKDLGVTAVELMPVAQFPGERNWGYDGVFPYAVQASYGGPDGLRRLVDAAHGLGMAVILDVVYNHVGPEGNCLREFGPYFSGRHTTPWGAGLNFDDAHSDEVRRFFIENALYWVRDFHVDALRLDAVHAIVDTSAVPFLEELAAAIHEVGRELGRRVMVIAESDLNDARLIRPRRQGGFEMDAQWSDDLHHSLHAILTGERHGYYAGFGGLGQLAKAMTDAFVYSGQYDPHRLRRYGNSPGGLPGAKFVVAAQNHDQVGNRMLGERLSNLVSFEALKLAAGVVLLSPFVPLLFMGEEYAEKAPFLYFVDHGEPGLVEAVRKGRGEEFRAPDWQGEPPDPQAAETFQRSKLDHSLRDGGHHQRLHAFYSELLALRREIPALGRLSRDDIEVEADEGAGTILLRRWHEESQVMAAFNFGQVQARVLVGSPHVSWQRRFDSADEAWGGPGCPTPELVDEPAAVALRPLSFVLYERTPR
jgi:maltooligosyltrehalose trehalohydrolase